MLHRAPALAPERGGGHACVHRGVCRRGSGAYTLGAAPEYELTWSLPSTSTNWLSYCNGKQPKPELEAAEQRQPLREEGGAALV